MSPFARPLREDLARDFRTQARTLLGAVAILLVVACANVASVMLARALARRREMGIRLAVGASRTRLARQLFVENVVLAALGRRGRPGARVTGRSARPDHDRRRSVAVLGELRFRRCASARSRSS